MATSSKPSGRHAPLLGRRILVAEDEYFLADDIGHALRSAGAEVAGPIGELDEALAILDSGVLDGAVLDVNLRDQMVFPLAQTLRKRQIPFVFTTGYDKSYVAPEFHDIILWEKPIDIGALVRSLTRLIDDRQP